MSRYHAGESSGLDVAQTAISNDDFTFLAFPTDLGGEDGAKWVANRLTSPLALTSPKQPITRRGCTGRDSIPAEARPHFPLITATIQQLCDQEASATAELQKPAEILRPREIELQAASLINVPALRQCSSVRLLHPQQSNKPLPDFVVEASNVII